MRVQTMGSASVAYPSGPEYLHHVNTRDPVPQHLGMANSEFLDKGKKGPINRFEVKDGVHNIRTAYASQLVPFQDFAKTQATVAAKGSKR